MAKERYIRSNNPDIRVVDYDIEAVEAITLPPANPTAGFVYEEGAVKRFADGLLYSYIGGVWIALAPQAKFTSDTTVSLSGGKLWLGVYPTGTTVATNGKTDIEVMQGAAKEAIAPSLTLTSPTTVQFNQPGINNVLNFTKTINTLGASVATAVLQWRRNGTGAWVTLDSNTTHTTFTHSLTDSAYNAQPFNYKYTVTDNGGGTNTVFLDITPVAYATPSITLIETAVSLTSIESNSVREKGNINTNISGTITRQSPNVDLVSYKLQYSVNGGAWTDISGATGSLSGSSGTIPSTNHNNTALNASDNIAYRVVVTDTYTSTNPSGATNSNPVTVSFYYRISFGPAASDPTDRTSVIALSTNTSPGNPNILSNASNVLLLNTGTTYLNQYVLLPPGRSINTTTAPPIDTSASGALVTYAIVGSSGSFTGFTDPTGATISGYTLWKRTQGTAYGSNHIHQITT